MKAGNKVDIWDILILLGAVLIIIWAMLKALGVIHSPAWLEVLPYFGAGVSIIGGAYKLGKIKSGIELIERRVARLPVIEERLMKLELEHNLAMQGKIKH